MEKAYSCFYIGFFEILNDKNHKEKGPILIIRKISPYRNLLVKIKYITGTKHRQVGGWLNTNYMVFSNQPSTLADAKSYKLNR
ncbi:MAG: hypothetical protein BroJett041_24530 [Candidatus Jettenia caeni]|nr:MAG: hypothetical protein BroJett041_24530 [Candidatus Jettenia caeni]GJQ46193.1 MAG: hypothetical protein JETCAE04_19470 [Candidatus Jettenia caeni]